VTTTPISRLPAATSLTGAEVVPIVQNGKTRRAAVDDLRAGSPRLETANVFTAAAAWEFDATGALPSLTLRRTRSDASVVKQIAFPLGGDDPSLNDASHWSLRLRHASPPVPETVSTSDTHLEFIGPGALRVNGLGLLASGVAFPATQIAASDPNTLDDYEEGAWTPALSASGAVTSVAYAARHGVYVKIGSLVSIFGYVEISAISGGGGYLFVGGLPFVAGRGAFPATSPGAIFGVGFASGNSPKMCSAYSNSITIYSYNEARELTTISPSSVSGGSYFTMSLQYIAAD